ncbi:hypothetical protein MHYP_G00290090 [Metynnis hypsauchen]
MLKDPRGQSMGIFLKRRALTGMDRHPAFLEIGGEIPLGKFWNQSQVTCCPITLGQEAIRRTQNTITDSRTPAETSTGLLWFGLCLVLNHLSTAAEEEARAAVPDQACFRVELSASQCEQRKEKKRKKKVQQVWLGLQRKARRTQSSAHSWL